MKNNNHPEDKIISFDEFDLDKIDNSYDDNNIDDPDEESDEELSEEMENVFKITKEIHTRILDVCQYDIGRAIGLKFGIQMKLDEEFDRICQEITFNFINNLTLNIVAFIPDFKTRILVDRQYKDAIVSSIISYLSMMSMFFYSVK